MVLEFNRIDNQIRFGGAEVVTIEAESRRIVDCGFPIANLKSCLIGNRQSQIGNAP